MPYVHGYLHIDCNNRMVWCKRQHEVHFLLPVVWYCIGESLKKYSCCAKRGNRPYPLLVLSNISMKVLTLNRRHSEQKKMEWTADIGVPDQSVFGCLQYMLPCRLQCLWRFWVPFGNMYPFACKGRETVTWVKLSQVKLTWPSLGKCLQFYHKDSWQLEGPLEKEALEKWNESW